MPALCDDLAHLSTCLRLDLFSETVFYYHCNQSLKPGPELMMKQQSQAHRHARADAALLR